MLPYDKKCYDLADYFLDADPSSAARVNLAHHIQNAIKDWLHKNRTIAIWDSISPIDMCGHFEIPSMSDAEIIETVKRIRRHHLFPDRAGHRAFAEGLTLRLERAGVTEAYLERLGL